MYMSVVLFFIYNVLQLSVCPKSADIPPPWRCIQKNWNHRHHPDKWPTDGQHRLVMPGSTPLQLAARASTWYRWMTLDFLQDKQNRMLTSNKSDDSSSINNQLSPLEKKTIPGRAGASWPFQLHFFSPRRCLRPFLFVTAMHLRQKRSQHAFELAVDPLYITSDAETATARLDMCRVVVLSFVVGNSWAPRKNREDLHFHVGKHLQWNCIDTNIK